MIPILIYLYSLRTVLYVLQTADSGLPDRTVPLLVPLYLSRALRIPDVEP